MQDGFLRWNPKIWWGQQCLEAAKYIVTPMRINCKLLDLVRCLCHAGMYVEVAEWMLPNSKQQVKLRNNMFITNHHDFPCYFLKGLKESRTQRFARMCSRPCLTRKGIFFSATDSPLCSRSLPGQNLKLTQEAMPSSRQERKLKSSAADISVAEEWRRRYSRRTGLRSGPARPKLGTCQSSLLRKWPRLNQGYQGQRKLNLSLPRNRASSHRPPGALLPEPARKEGIWRDEGHMTRIYEDYSVRIQ